MIELNSNTKFGIVSTIILLLLTIAIRFYNGERFQTAIAVILFFTWGYGFLFIFKDSPAMYLAVKQNIMTYGDGTSILRPLSYTILDILIMLFAWSVIAKRAKQFPETEEEEN